MITTVHVTRVSGADVYGHLTCHCDAAGCSGDELYFAGIDGTHVFPGDIAESATLSHSHSAQAVHCACGATRNERCVWTGPGSDTAVVEWMPEWIRASHTAAGNHGTYPHNGALRLRCERSCADRLIESDPEWTSEVSS